MLLLVVSGPAAILFSLLSVTHELQQIQTQNTRLVAQRVTHAPRRQASSPSEQLQKFYAFLPATQHIPDAIASIRAAASHQGVALPEGTLKLVIEKDNPIGRYEMTFPVKAEYHQTRDFVREVLRTIPSVALEDLSFRRDHVNDPVLDTRVQFALYLRVDN